MFKILTILFLCIAVVAEAQQNCNLTGLPLKAEGTSIQQDIPQSMPLLQDVTVKINFRNQDTSPNEAKRELCSTCASCLSKKKEIANKARIEQTHQTKSEICREQQPRNLRVSFYGDDQRNFTPKADRRAYVPRANQRTYAPKKKLRIYIPRSKVKFYLPKDRKNSTNNDPAGSRIYYRVSECNEQY